MKARTTLVLAAMALLAIPAVSGAGKGTTLVDKDTGRGKSAVAVARGTVKNPGELRLVISTKPRRKRVQWSYTTDCKKGGENHRYPPAGEHVDRTGRSKIRSRIKKAVASPDECTVAVSAKLDYKRGKKVTAKILHKR